MSTIAGGGGAALSGRGVALRCASVAGALIGYGFLAAFLYLVSLQTYHWVRHGEWTHVGVSDALRSGWSRCCVAEADSARVSGFLHWLDAPSDWLGLHQVLEVVPASLALFLVSVLGNCLFIYYRERARAEGART